MTEDPQELYEKLCAFIKTAPIEVQTAFELNEKCNGITIDSLLKAKRTIEEMKQTMARAISYIQSGDADVAEGALQKYFPSAASNIRAEASTGAGLSNIEGE